MIEDSDDEECDPPQPQIVHTKLKEDNERFEEMRKALKEIQRGYPELKLAYEKVKEETEKEAKKKVFYYKKWYATLTDEEKNLEDDRKYNQGACES